MKIRERLTTVIGIAALVAVAGGTVASTDETSDSAFGYQVMSPGERAEHRNRMRSLGTEAERESYRREHHEAMRARAAERGLALPDEPLARPQGRGHGRGRASRRDD